VGFEQGGDGTANCLPQDGATNTRSGGRRIDTSEDDLHERGDGDVSARVGAALSYTPALELPAIVPAGAAIRADKLRGATEASGVAVELHSQCGAGGQHVRALDPGYGAQLHGALQHARTSSAHATTMSSGAVPFRCWNFGV